MTKISVIVPIYNADRFLSKCIDSIIAQTFPEFELLLINDGSTDSSATICDRYANKDARIKVFHKENGGVSSARQVGIDNSVGEYTIHVDPDDYIESNMLELLYNKAIEEQADMVICDYYEEYVKKEETIYISQKPSKLDSNIVLSELFQHLHGSCCNKLIRRSCYNRYNIKFPIEISFCEDLYVCAAILKNNIKVSYLAKAFYHYTQDINDNSLVNSYTKRTLFNDFKRNEYFYSLLEGTDSFSITIDFLKQSTISRAYKANILSSQEFKRNFYNDRKWVISYTQNPFHIRFFYYMSCIGFYTVIHPVHNFCQKIKYSLKLR